MSRLTFFEVVFIGFAMTLWQGNNEFMSDMRHAHIDWFVRYPVGLVSWGAAMAIAAIVWRVVFGKGRWS